MCLGCAAWTECTGAVLCAWAVQPGLSARGLCRAEGVAHRFLSAFMRISTEQAAQGAGQSGHTWSRLRIWSGLHAAGALGNLSMLGGDSARGAGCGLHCPSQGKVAGTQQSACALTVERLRTCSSAPVHSVHPLPSRAPGARCGPAAHPAVPPQHHLCRRRATCAAAGPLVLLQRHLCCCSATCAAAAPLVLLQSHLCCCRATCATAEPPVLLQRHLCCCRATCAAAEPPVLLQRHLCCCRATCAAAEPLVLLQSHLCTGTTHTPVALRSRTHHADLCLCYVNERV